MAKKTMKVREMQEMLGLGKTDSYWLLKKGYFRTYRVLGKLRIDMESFEEWYASQFHYKKVVGEAPGKKYANTMSVVEMSALLGLSPSTGYYLINKGHFEVTIINGRKQVLRESFERWYQGQSYYKKTDQ